MFDTQLTALAASLAEDSAGRSSAASIAIIAITTRSSIKVNFGDGLIFRSLQKDGRHTRPRMGDAYAFLAYSVIFACNNMIQRLHAVYLKLLFAECC